MKISFMHFCNKCGIYYLEGNQCTCDQEKESKAMTEYVYYLVQKEGGGPAKHRHPTYESAKTEAHRLAEMLGGRFTILMAMGEVVNMGVYHNRYVRPTQFSDEVPF